MITAAQLEKSKQVFEAWTGLTPAQHHERIYQAGLERIDILSVPGSKYSRKLEGSRQFWTWWRRDWNLKNELAMLYVGIDPYELPSVIEPHTREALLECSTEIHSSSTITFPSKALVI